MTTACEPCPDIAKIEPSIDITSDARQYSARELDLDRVRNSMKEQLERLAPGPAKEAGHYQLNTGGSLMRARLALASGDAFGASLESSIAAAAACELIHNASLVHDDLTDRDSERRSAPTVWRRFGDGVALCTGDLLLCAAFRSVAELNDPQASNALVQTLSALTSQVILGQSIELNQAATGGNPKLKDYLNATTSKTVPFIELPLMTGAVLARPGEHVKEQIRKLAYAVGLAYQIIDDLDDIKMGMNHLHPFHALRHHSRVAGGSGAVRLRIVQHARAALSRARWLLVKLDSELLRPLSPELQPILETLELRVLSNRGAIQVEHS